MRKIVIAIFIFGTTFSFAEDSLSVRGKEAKELYQSLKSAGALVKQWVESTELGVKSVDCDSNPRAFVWAQCTMSDKNSRTAKNLTPIGSPALRVFSALHKAGITPKRNGFGSRILVSEVDCFSGYTPRTGVYYQCTIVK